MSNENHYLIYLGTKHGRVLRKDILSLDTLGGCVGISFILVLAPEDCHG